MVQWSHADAVGSDSLMTRFVIVGGIEIYLYLQKAIKLVVFCQLGFLKAVNLLTRTGTFIPGPGSFHTIFQYNHKFIMNKVSLFNFI